MPTGKVLEVGCADAAPSDERLQRFQRLAKLQLSRSAAFDRWAKDRELTADQKEIAKESWNAAWCGYRIEDMWEIIKRLTVFDESFRLPTLKDSTEFRGNVEEKFGKLMLATSLLTLEIQRDYENSAEQEKPCLQ